MLVNIHHDSPREHARLLVAGIGFVALIAGLLALSIAIYEKAFTRVETIVIKADRAGLQMQEFGDVRIDGALIGQVRSVTQDGEEAAIEVAIEPEAAERIPANVNVQIVPTTLFGQKFVAFVRPAAPSAQTLADVDEIPADRVDTNVELGQVLDRLFPLLKAVRPVELNYTLTALATALQGNGEKLGVTLEQLDDFLVRIKPDLPALRQSLIELAEVSDLYADVAPDILATLDNVTTTGRTIVESDDELEAFFADLTGLSNTTTEFLAANEEGLVRLGEVSVPLLQLLARYSPEFPCLLRGVAKFEPILDGIFSGNQVRQYIEIPTPQYNVYKEEDKPTYGNLGRGPWCLTLPKFGSNPNPPPLNQGTTIDENPPRGITGAVLPTPRTAARSSMAGSQIDQDLINTLLAERSGRSAASYGSLGSLLYGPVVRGEGR